MAPFYGTKSFTDLYTHWLSFSSAGEKFHMGQDGLIKELAGLCSFWKLGGAAICVLAFTSFQRLPPFLGPFIFKASNGQPVFLTCI